MPQANDPTTTSGEPSPKGNATGTALANAEGILNDLRRAAERAQTARLAEILAALADKEAGAD